MRGEKSHPDFKSHYPQLFPTNFNNEPIILLVKKLIFENLDNKYFLQMVLFSQITMLILFRRKINTGINFSDP